MMTAILHLLSRFFMVFVTILLMCKLNEAIECLTDFYEWSCKLARALTLKHIQIYYCKIRCIRVKNSIKKESEGEEEEEK